MTKKSKKRMKKVHFNQEHDWDPTGYVLVKLGLPTKKDIEEGRYEKVPLKLYRKWKKNYEEFVRIQNKIIKQMDIAHEKLMEELKQAYSETKLSQDNCEVQSIDEPKLTTISG